MAWDFAERRQAGKRSDVVEVEIDEVCDVLVWLQGRGGGAAWGRTRARCSPPAESRSAKAEESKAGITSRE